MYWYDSYNKEKNQLSLYYLFLSSEKKLSDADFALFEELGESVKGFSEMKEDIIEECEKLLVPSNGSKSRFEIVTEAFSSYKTSGGTADTRDYSILWALVSMQYRKEIKSNKKQQLIELWAEAKRIDKSVVIEMCDTCETQNATTEYRTWLETNKSLTYMEVNSFIQELDKNLKSMQQSVSDLIALG